MTFDSAVQDPRYAAPYGPARPALENLLDDEQSPPDAAFLEDWLVRTGELVDLYQPQLVWFDWWIQNRAFSPYLRKLASYCSSRGAQWGRGVATNYKREAFAEECAVLDIERGRLPGIRPLFWQTDTSVHRTAWGYVAARDYKSTTTILHDVVDIVSKNGALLLTVGPRPDGTIPEPEAQVLLALRRRPSGRCRCSGAGRTCGGCRHRMHCTSRRPAASRASTPACPGSPQRSEEKQEADASSRLQALWRYARKDTPVAALKARRKLERSL